MVDIINLVPPGVKSEEEPVEGPVEEAPVEAPAEEAPAEEAPAEEAPAEEALPEVTSPPMRAENNGDFCGGFEDNMPCNWHIVPLKDSGPDQIEAYNSQTQERFVGTMVDFNAALRV